MADDGLLPVNVSNNLDVTQVQLSETAGRIASELQSGSAPAGSTQLSFYEYLASLSAAYGSGTVNAQAELGATAAAENGTQQIGAALQSLSALSAAASNDFLSQADRQTLQAQANADVRQINQIAGTAAYDGTNLLNANTSSQIQTGPYPSSITQLHFPDVTPAALGISNLDLSTTASAQASSGAIAGALAALSAAQGALGTQADAIESQIKTNAAVSTTLQNLAANVSGPNAPESIQQFKLESTQEGADLITLARAGRQLNVTLGILDTSA